MTDELPSERNSLSYSILTTFFMGVFLFIGSFILLSVYADWLRYTSRVDNAVTIDARIANREEERDEGSTAYFVEYEYEVDGTTYSRRDQVDPAFYNDEAEMGRRIPVTYDATNPANFNLGSRAQPPYYDMLMLAGVALIFVGIGLGGVLVGIRSILGEIRRRRRA